eukprot:TRINITY_DN2464_c0_g1_i1.p1 TRINITY_DN2464_c0_g1~~TRINITY_DN2464_c0_g1_i1.p1  ORF type:complete len:261 (-),score=59.02 TRINITY_DN2464_c0_g1_i1:345-1127(-)
MGVVSPNQLVANDVWKGVRSFYFDFPKDGMAHSLSFLARSSLSLTDVFSSVTVSLGTCNTKPRWVFDASTPCVKSDGVTPNPCLSDLNNQLDGLLMKDLLSGRWWVNFQFKSNNPFPILLSDYWGFEVKPVTTCSEHCFTHGECVEVPAYCRCDTFWDGDDCSYVFRGVYVVVGWLVIFVLVIIIAVARWMWISAKKGKFDGVVASIKVRRGNRTASDSDEEILSPNIEGGEEIFVSEKASLLPRSRKSTVNDSEEMSHS